MKKLVCSLAVVALSAVSAFAQEPAEHQQVSAEQPLDSQLNLTPEMVMYLQALRRYDDPRQAVRRNAEQRGAERRARIAAMKWYGFSNSRPQASPVPTMGTYSPVWSSSTTAPYQWFGSGYPGYAPSIFVVPMH